MIFVTVGTHEQPFDRLIKCVDELKRDNKIKENVIIQTGYSNYEPNIVNGKNYILTSKCWIWLKMQEL